VYVGVCNPNAGAPGAGVLCLDAATGKEIWRAASPLGDVRGPVTARQGVVYATTGESWVVAYDAESGRSLWSRPLQATYRHGRPLGINQTPPIPTRHGLLVSDWQRPLYLLDFRTGKTIAERAGNTGYYAAFATVFDDVLYCACRGGSRAAKMPGGELEWEAEETARSTSAGIVADGKYLYTAASSVKARDAATGQVLWQTAVPNAGYQNPVPVVWDDLVLVNGTNFVAVDLKTGEPRWTVPCAQDAGRFRRCRRHKMAGSSTPVVAGALAYFGHDDTSIRAVNRHGNVRWEHRLGVPVKTSPTVSGNLLFVHDFAGNLWCFAPRAD
jgi:outer membrane protein assembly factor BamB